MVKSSFFHLRRLSKIKSLLSVKPFEQIIHWFVLSRLDYCNSLYYGISQSSIMRLQMVQNAAARLITGRRRFDHISPILISLNWLPVKSRIICKILTFVFKSLQNQAPSYLSKAISTSKPNRSLRSGLLSVSRSRFHCRGDRAFAVAGPSLWNKLPTSMRAVPSLPVFKCQLKKHLLSIAFI